MEAAAASAYNELMLTVRNCDNVKKHKELTILQA
jgi:hypothetical protein